LKFPFSLTYLAAQLNAAYIDGQISWLTNNLAASTADYNIVIVSAHMHATTYSNQLCNAET
jgi:hypothetical protein